MLRFRFAPVAGCLVVALGLVLPAASAQKGAKAPRRRAQTTPAVVRQVYSARGRSASELAKVLALHFKAEPAFAVVADAGSNTLLLSGPPAALEDAAAALRQIDRPTRTVHVEVLLLELTGPAPAKEAGADAKGPALAELSGPARDVDARVRDLQRRGLIASVRRVRLTGLEGQVARVQLGENRPSVTGATFAGGGPPGRGGPGAGGAGGGFPGRGGMVSRSITYRNVGTLVQVTPEVGLDGLVALDLRVEDSRMRGPEGGVALGAGDNGAPVSAPGFASATLESRLRVRPGHVVVAQATSSTAKMGRAEAIILVGASTDEAGLRDGK
jgi:hypothetical protein